MNSGILDAHNLAYRIAKGLSGDSVEEYSAERRASVKAVISKADQLYERSLSIAKELGLNPRNLEIFESALKPLQGFSFTQNLYEFGRKIGTSHLQIPALSNRLGQSLRTKGLHIPLIIPEYEFLQVVSIQEPGRSRKLLLMSVLNQQNADLEFRCHELSTFEPKSPYKSLKVKEILTQPAGEQLMDKCYLVWQPGMPNSQIEVAKKISNVHLVTTMDSMFRLLHKSTVSNDVLQGFLKEHSQSGDSCLLLTVRSDGMLTLRSESSAAS